MFLFDQESRTFVDKERGISFHDAGNGRDLRDYRIFISSADWEIMIAPYDRVVEGIGATKIDEDVWGKKDNWKAMVGPNPQIVVQFFGAKTISGSRVWDEDTIILAKEAIFALNYNTFGAQALRRTKFYFEVGFIKPIRSLYEPPSEYFTEPYAVTYPTEYEA